ELLMQPGLPDARFALEEHDLAVGRLRAREQLVERPQLPVAADEAPELPLLDVRTLETRRLDPVEGDRLADAAELARPDRHGRHDVADERPRVLREKDLARRRLRLHARRDVGSRSERKALRPATYADLAGDDRPGVQADPHLERDFDLRVDS